MRETKNIFYHNIKTKHSAIKKISYITRNQAKFVDKSLFARITTVTNPPLKYELLSLRPLQQ